MAAEAPSVTDWLQGIGTIAALPVAVVALWFTARLFQHEIRVRREEKADADIAHARLVFVRAVELRTKDEKLSSVRYEIVNHGADPIFQVEASIVTSSGAAGHSADELDGLVGSRAVEMLIDPPIPAVTSTTVRDVSLTVTFTDTAGLRWRRTGRDQPERLLASAPAGTGSEAPLALAALTLGLAGIVLGLIALIR